MKKISLFAMTGILLAGAASAGFEPNKLDSAKGGFVGGKETIVSVKQVKEMRDDVNVVVEGKIIQRIGDDKYLFEDSTGSITVEIDDKDWRGQTVTPSDTVKLYGEVDRGIMKTEIEVDYIHKM